MNFNYLVDTSRCQKIMNTKVSEDPVRPTQARISRLSQTWLTGPRAVYARRGTPRSGCPDFESLSDDQWLDVVSSRCVTALGLLAWSWMIKCWHKASVRVDLTARVCYLQRIEGTLGPVRCGRLAKRPPSNRLSKWQAG